MAKDQTEVITQTSRKRGWPLLNMVLAANAVLIGLLFLGLANGQRWVVLQMPLILLAAVQLIAGAVSLFTRGRRAVGAIAVITAPFAGVIGLLAGGISGWGRPLRVKGRQVHPDLREGSDWTEGPLPSADGLDHATSRALEVLWLHDAQKEHASVPAFARISWMLAAVGAPADLSAWCHRAALEEVEHARLCFAAAAGYGGRSHTVEPMPDLLLSGLDLQGDPLVVLAVESLTDGCQLEDFNADIAGACARVCREPVTRALLERIAREERSHAEFSWALLAWTLARKPEAVRPAIARAKAALAGFQRPHAVNPDQLPVIAQADPNQLLSHGRLPDEHWERLWAARLAATHDRLEQLMRSTAPASLATCDSAPA